MSQERTVGQRPAVRGLAVRWAHLKFGLDVDGRANVSSSVLCIYTKWRWLTPCRRGRAARA